MKKILTFAACIAGAYSMTSCYPKTINVTDVEYVKVPPKKKTPPKKVVKPKDRPEDFRAITH